MDLYVVSVSLSENKNVATRVGNSQRHVADALHTVLVVYAELARVQAGCQ